MLSLTIGSVESGLVPNCVPSETGSSFVEDGTSHKVPSEEVNVIGTEVWSMGAIGWSVEADTSSEDPPDVIVTTGGMPGGGFNTPL